MVHKHPFWLYRKLAACLSQNRHILISGNSTFEYLDLFLDKQLSYQSLCCILHLTQVKVLSFFLMYYESSHEVYSLNGSVIHPSSDCAVCINHTFVHRIYFTRTFIMHKRKKIESLQLSRMCIHGKTQSTTPSCEKWRNFYVFLKCYFRYG